MTGLLVFVLFGFAGITWWRVLRTQPPAKGADAYTDALACCHAMRVSWARGRMAVRYGEAS